MTFVNFTKNNKPNTSRFIECFPFVGEPRTVRTIDLDQFLYDLDNQIWILQDYLYDLGYAMNSADDENCYAELDGQISALEMIRSQFDGF
jgi:hypothetical protein